MPAPRGLGGIRRLHLLRGQNRPEAPPTFAPGVCGPWGSARRPGPCSRGAWLGGTRRGRCPPLRPGCCAGLAGRRPPPLLFRGTRDCSGLQKAGGSGQGALGPPQSWPGERCDGRWPAGLCSRGRRPGAVPLAPGGGGGGVRPLSVFGSPPPIWALEPVCVSDPVQSVRVPPQPWPLRAPPGLSYPTHLSGSDNLCGAGKSHGAATQPSLVLVGKLRARAGGLGWEWASRSQPGKHPSQSLLGPASTGMVPIFPSREEPHCFSGCHQRLTGSESLGLEQQSGD